MPLKRANPASTNADFQRKFAVACFNKTWDLLDKKERSRGEDLQMLLEAHTSRYHWGQIGNPRNFAVGDWQISRVYASLKQPDLALLFARCCLDTCEENGLKDLLASAHEGMARAYAAGNNMKEAKRYLQSARKQLELVTDADRKIYGQQIDETEALITN